jgi:hypothetical protein
MEVDGGFRGRKFKYDFEVGKSLKDWRDELEYGQWEWKEGCVKYGTETMSEEWAKGWVEKCQKEYPGCLGKKREE